MTTPELSPYDTGARCEPKLWQPTPEAVEAIMRSGDVDDIGNVDFDDGEGHTVATIHLSRGDDGQFTLHVMPLCEVSELTIEIHSGETFDDDATAS